MSTGIGMDSQRLDDPQLPGALRAEIGSLGLQDSDVESAKKVNFSFPFRPPNQTVTDRT